MGDEVLLDAVLAVGTTYATLLHTGMEALHGLEVLAVDVGLAKLQFTGHAGGCVNIFREDTRRQSVLTVVSPFDGLFNTFKLNQRNHGTEGFLVDDIHLLGAVVQYGSGIEVALVAHTMTATEQLGSLLDGAFHLLGDALQGTGFYQGTHVDGMVLADIAYADGLHLLDQNVGKLLLDGLVDVDALGVVAYLSVVADATVYNPLGSLLQVGILADDGRSLATQFEAHLGDILRSSCHDALAGTHRTRHADDVNLGRACHLVADDTSPACDNVDDALGQSHLVDDLAEDGTVLGSQLRGFDDDGTAGNEGSTSLAGNQEEGEVPGQDACNHTDGFLGEEDGLVRTVAGNDFTLDVTGKRRHIVKVLCCDVHLDGRPSEGLALLAHDDVDKLFTALTDSVGQFLQPGGTLDGGRLGPLLLGPAGSVQSSVYVFDGSFRLTGDDFFGRGVQHVNPLAVAALAELAVNVHL